MRFPKKLDFIQRSLRAETKQKHRIQKTGQLEIFQNGEISEDRSERPDVEDVKKYWIVQLSEEPKDFGIIKLADMIEDTGWFISDFEQAFKELENEQKVVNLDAKKRRPKHPVHFEKNNGRGEFLKLK